MRTITVALTGGIAAGKSVAAQRLRERGAHLIDYDYIARIIVEPGSPCLSAIVKDFGPAVLNAQGQLDRQGLGKLIFADPAARARLNAIMHPAIYSYAAECEATIRAHKEPQGPGLGLGLDTENGHNKQQAPGSLRSQKTSEGDVCVIVHDIPLFVDRRIDGPVDSGILEEASHSPFDLVVTVYAPPALRLDRLMSTRGLSQAEAEARLASQAHESQRLAVADIILDGSRSQDQLHRQIDRLWDQLQIWVSPGT